MKTSTKIAFLLATFTVAIFTVASQFIPVREVGVRYPQHTTNSGELVAGTLVGQTFAADQDNLSAISILFATYSNRANTQPIHFHLRQSLADTQDLRSATIQPQVLGDNQFYRFTFEPLPDSKGKTFFFFVESPQSLVGNAVAIDIDSRDPYHLGTAFIVRSPAGTTSTPELVARSGKVTQDIGFETYYTVPLRAAAVNAGRSAVRDFIITWAERRSHYLILGQVAAPMVAFVVVLLGLTHWRRAVATDATITSRRISIILLGLIALGILLRLLYATELPVTDDEGNYLYDARSIRQGILAGGDGYVKAPVVIAWIALWQLLLGDTVIAGRLASIVIGALLVIPIYHIGRLLVDRFTGLAAAAVWALFGAAVLANVYVHTQSVALFFGVSGIAVLYSALGITLTRATSLTLPTNSYRPGRLIFAGMLLGLGVASRKSILSLGLVPLVLILVGGLSWPQRLRSFGYVGLGFGLVIAAFLGLAGWQYGPVGVIEAIGMNSAEDGAITLDPTEIAQVRAYSLRGMTPFFRESLPLILLSLIGWGMLLEKMMRAMVQRFLYTRPSRLKLWLLEYVVPKLGWALPLLVFWWCATFFFEYEGSAFMLYGMRILWYFMGAVLVGITLLPRARHEHYALPEVGIVLKSTQPHTGVPNVITAAASATPITARPVRGKWPTQEIIAALVLPAWVGGLAFFYANWIKFHANYISEFIPPLAILSGVGALLLWHRLKSFEWLEERHAWSALGMKVISLVVLVVLGWSIFLSNYITYLYEHTGTFQQAAAQEAAAWARANIPLEQPIFTGAALIPYLSGHHTVLDIAHPRWYAYEFTRKDPERLNTFLPPAETMVEAFRHSPWFLLDKQTGFSFLMEYSEIEASLNTDFTAVHGISNGSNTLTFYKRK